MSSSRRLPVSYNEKTFGTLAAGRDYTSFTTWESDTDNDLVANAKGEVLTCYADQPSYSAAFYQFSDATTNTSYFRVLRAANGHRGTLTSGVRFGYAGTGSLGNALWVSENNVGIYDIAVWMDLTAGVNAIAIGIQIDIQTGAKIVGCTAYDCLGSGTGRGHGFLAYLPDANADRTVYFANCFAYNCGGGSSPNTGGFCLWAPNNRSITGYFYNCTARSCARGLMLLRTTGTLTAISKNCVFQDNTTNIYTSGTLTHTPTTNATSGVTFNADGYHLKPDFEGTARNQGTNLSADPYFAFDDDIDGDTITRGWSIGCDWYAPIAGNPTGTGGTSRRTPLYYYNSTYGNSSRGYTVLATWESDTDNTLTTSAAGEVLTCYADSATYNDSIVVAGATVNSNYFRVIRAASGQRGTRTSGVRFERSMTTSYVYAGLIALSESYAKCHDIAAKVTGTNSTTYVTAFWGTATYTVFTNCTAYDCIAPSQFACGFMPGTGYVGFINCYAYNCTGANSICCGFHFNGFFGADNTDYVYNCVARSCKLGFYMLSNPMRNCISQNNTTNLSGTPAQITNRIGLSVVFNADGYHLDTSDTVAKNQGTDLSTDITFPFCDDIDGDTRPTGAGTWDIGADEYVALILGPINLKSYNTNLKSNIKSVNGNLIANVKSINNI
ncbi:MAG: hypothetical protein WA087_02100 [Candidatus Saccharimonadales bacterium]